MRIYVPLVSRTRIVMTLLALGIAPLFPSAHAQTFKVLYSFTGGADGGTPEAGLVFDAAGNLYGTTSGGGDAGCFNGTCGVVFKLSPGARGWTESVLHTFTGGSDGGNPFDSPLLDAAGNLYGTAEVGGVSCGQTYGCGVALELTPGSSGWKETVLHSFNGGDGYYPVAALTPDKRGNLYSTIPSGQVYELTKGRSGWKETTLYTFDCSVSYRRGGEPNAAPILDAAGNLYGTTPICGSSGGDGTVFELLHGSWKEKTLHEFRFFDGANPEGGLVFDKAGNLYGTTETGGKFSQGTVFKLAPTAGGKWKETVLYSFRGGDDGKWPFSTPVFDKAGNLYGTTFRGGTSGCAGYGCGTVFKLTPTSGGHWKEKVLYAFKGGRDGSHPATGSLAIDGAGNLYGTAGLAGNAGCGGFGCGVVFEITP